MFEVVKHVHDFSRVGGLQHTFSIRDGAYDKAILTEVMQYSVLPYKGRTVLDLGANIGAFTVMAYQLGAKKVVAVEPDPDNFDLLHENVKTCEPTIVNLYRAAATTQWVSTLPLYKSKTGKNPGTHSLFVKGGRDEIEVPTINWCDLTGMHKFDTIKMDVEGAEHDLLLAGGVPDSVDQIVFELHLNKKDWRRNTGPKIIELFKDWECLREPRVTDSNWATWAAYRR